jgi:hypothetical protein
MKVMSGKLSENLLYFPNQLLSLVNFTTTTHINLVNQISKVHVEGNEIIENKLFPFKGQSYYHLQLSFIIDLIYNLCTYGNGTTHSYL